MEFYMTPDFYGYEPFLETPTAGAEVFGFAGVLLGFFAVFYLAMFALSIVCYIFQAIGIYTVAKRRQINNPWLAWIPVGVLWILGSISDQYQYVAKGRVRNRRKILLGTSIAMLALAFVEVIAAVIFAVGVAGESALAAGLGGIVTLLCSLATLVLTIIVVVFTYITMYDLYASCDPPNATTYLVLSIVFGIAQPFFIFFSRKKDLGMPPRREAPQPFVQPVAQPVVQPVLPVVEQIPAEPVYAEAPVEETPVEEIPTEE